MGNSFCSSCGKQNDSEAIFCSSCGAPLKREANPQSEYTSQNQGMPNSIPGSTDMYKHENQNPYGQNMNNTYPNMQPQLNREQSNPTVWIVLNIIFSVISLLFIPILFGGLGIFFGYMVKKSKNSLGTGLMILAGVCMFIGFIIGVLVGMFYQYGF